METATNHTQAPSASLAERTYSKPSKVAKRLGLHKNTVLRWLKIGRLTPHKIGDTVLIANDEVEALLHAARIEKTPVAA
jgi:excisionase family DNA binding protein